MVRLVAGVMLALVTVGGCASHSAALNSATPTASASPTASSSQSVPTTSQWCAGYSAILKVLATNGTDATAAATALATLDRFDLIWRFGARMGLVTADESDANRRAVAAYRAIMTLIAGGHSASSPEVARATANLTAITNSDRALLISSAGKVRATCGTPSTS